MKFTIAYYLFLIYATVILKPLIPVAEDTVMHFFGEAYHIATVHAAEGKDHVEKEMADSGKDDAFSKTQKIDKAEQSLHETIAGSAFNFTNPYPLLYHYSFLNQFLRNIYIPYINPPPRIII